MVEQLSIEKKHLRKTHLANRRALSPFERQIKNRIIADKVSRFLANLHGQQSKPLSMAAYLPFPDEVNCLYDSLDILSQKDVNYQVSLPYFRKSRRGMRFMSPTDLGTFQDFLRKATLADTWIYPNPALWVETKPDTIPYWIIPGVAFTPDCYRIGFGGGHYDEWLSQQQGIFIGLAFEVQMAQTFFVPEPFDIPMDIVFTERHNYVRPESNIELSTLPGGTL